MGDLDTSLITEFSLVPAFYNKASPHFKDKPFIEQEWANISKKLGYDVTMLKDRMYQLRNRYNLEKRKVQAMRDDGLRNPKSSWPLFVNLRFLDNHIRPRKSYKDYTPNGNARPNAPRRGRPPLARKDAEIKNEEKDAGEGVQIFQREYETEDDAGNDTQNGDDFLNPANFLEDTESENNDIQLITDTNILNPVPFLHWNEDRHTNYSNGTTATQAPKPALTVRSINCLKRSLQDASNDNAYREAKTHKASDKFEAFGNFVTASLQDLPENKSLEIIEKFTNEIVRALIDN